MSPAQQQGARLLEGNGWSATVLPGPPLIAPTRQFTFPLSIVGEEDALARGALWVQVRDGQGTWLAQCALGFAGGCIAHGLWPLPGSAGFLACAGGYAYAVSVAVPQETTLLPARPAVAVLPLPLRTVFVTHHALLVRENDGELWSTPRLSWEGVTVTAASDSTVEGTGWDMVEDAEVPFRVDLLRRTAAGGGFTPPA